MNTEEFWKMLKTVAPDQYAEIKKQKEREEEEPKGLLQEFSEMMARKMKDADDQIADSLIKLRLDMRRLLEAGLVCRCPEMRRKYEEHGQSVGNVVQIRVNLDGLSDFCEANKGLWKHMYLEDDGQDVVIRLTNRERVQKRPSDF